MQIPNLDPKWQEFIDQESTKPYFTKLMEFVDFEYGSQTIFPERENIFRAMQKCSFDDVKVVIIGQDPYHGEGQAHGLCFSVAEGVMTPPSLVNIFKEISASMDKPIPRSGNLDRWAEQGVLLLNAVLTVRAHNAGSHAKKGWEKFTDNMVEYLATRKQNIVYMLWGSYAQQKLAKVPEAGNLLLKSVHPSPLSAYRGFLGCGHFTLANDYLTSIGKKPIDW